MSSPIPVSVTVVHPHPDTYPVAGYVKEKQYTLSYTLLKNKNDTVGGLLRAMGQYGPENGTSVTGVSAFANEYPLQSETPLVDGAKVYLSFVNTR